METGAVPLPTGYAGFWKRLAAYVIDNAIIGVTLLIFGNIVSFLILEY